MKKAKKKNEIIKINGVPKVDMRARRGMVVSPAAGSNSSREALVREYKKQMQALSTKKVDIDYSFVVKDVTGKVYDNLFGSFLVFANKRVFKNAKKTRNKKTDVLLQTEEG